MILDKVNTQSIEEYIPKDSEFWNLGGRQSRSKLLKFSVVGLSDEMSNDEYENSDQILNGWINQVKENFYSVPEVESIYLARVEESTHIWIIIPKRDFALLRRLVEMELRVMDMLGTEGNSALKLEFHITYRNGRDEKTLVPLQAIEIAR